MKIGVTLILTEALGDIAVIAQRAEALGFHSIWAPEHPVTPVSHSTRYPSAIDGKIPPQDRYVVNPMVALARASATTTRIKLATGASILPMHHPIDMAKQISTLDVYSGGRVIVGVGAGWFKEQMDIMKGNFEHRWEQARESVLAMKELWMKDEAEYHGKYVDFPLVHLHPKPVQKPHPPIFLAGFSSNILKRVVKWADGWIPNRIPSTMTPIPPEQMKKHRATLNELASEAGRDPKSIEIYIFGQKADRDLIRRHEDAGINGVMIRPTSTSADSLLAELDDIAEKVLI
jgi:probable F420-dependent oxidoreductase